ncbi:hypothetical protein V7266_25695 [Neobacillus drentensis]|uniref:hypothetical protein n=1 Tax=Neobacillus drentensis TaxID=220684 RepID=UPI002FFF8876
MGAFLGTIGVLGFIIFIILAIISSFRKTGKAKKRMLFAAGFFILFIMGIAITPDTEDTSNSSPKTEVKDKTKDVKQNPSNTNQKSDEAQKKPEEKTPQQQMIDKITGLIASKQAFDTGSYIKGDIPAGEYAFVKFKGSGEYYVEKDASDNIIDNQNFDSFGYVYVHGAGNIETNGVLINVGAFGTLGVSGAKQIYEILNNTQNYNESGYYKVGVDLQPGSYVIESYGEGYVAKMSGPVGKSDIIDNENFNGRYSVSVTNGQYLEISRGKIAQ